MEAWTIGLIVVLAVGLTVIVFGALSDRSKNKRAAAEILAPPKRDIPHFKPDAPSPHYLSDLQARRPPEQVGPTDLSQAQREKIARELKAGATIKVNVGYATGTFITDATSSWAVHDAPRILICEEPVGSIRELISVLEKLILSKTPLVIAAPAFSKEVLDTLEVNKIRRTMPLLAIATPTAQTLALIASATGGSQVSRTDLQAGYVLAHQLGSCERWVSNDKNSFVIGPPRSASGHDASH